MLQIESLHYYFKTDRVNAGSGRSSPGLHGVTMSVAAGEKLAVIGPNGAGKTTLLSIVAGHIFPSEGRILIGGTDVTELPPQARGVVTVFQDFGLFPHMSVEQNVEFPARVSGT